ncbi:MAG: hypothetical protein CVU50_02885 [Candidatus Cloacimonetes bacterium HGW-Cloacimonetes-3]|nr:MAG: hypothetical protein CVU50_02885 [Candidatus Cloacimonetes bacterium HGW-Cloacimonetes-3]
MGSLLAKRGIGVKISFQHREKQSRAEKSRELLGVKAKGINIKSCADGVQAAYPNFIDTCYLQ